MRFLPALFVALGLMLPAGLVAAAHGDTFPTLRGKSLSGVELTLPRDFKAHRILVFVAFTREQQKDLDAWLKVARSLVKKEKGLAWAEVPVFGDINFILKTIIQTAMRSKLTDAEEERVIPVYGQKAAVLKALSIHDESHMQSVLIDQKGKVLWQTQGKFTQQKLEHLKGALHPAPKKKPVKEKHEASKAGTENPEKTPPQLGRTDAGPLQ